MPMCQPMPLDVANSAPHTVLSPKPSRKELEVRARVGGKRGERVETPQGQVRGEGCAGRWGRQRRVSPDESRSHSLWVACPPTQTSIPAPHWPGA